MEIHRQVASRMNNQSGTTAIVVAIVIVILIGVTALAVDIGYVMATKNELQNLADGAALAAARQLGAIYQTMSYAQQQDYVCDPSTIIPIAQEVGIKNQAGGKNITIDTAEVIIGQWDANGKTLTPTLERPDAVRVTARRDGTANGPVTTFFARILGINSVDISARATAALTGQSTAGPGDVQLPIGISRHFFKSKELFCDETITFSPTHDPEACAGWTTFQLSPSNDITIRRILQEVSGYESPETIARKTPFEFIGGDLSQKTFDSLLLLFMKYGYDVKSDGNPVRTVNGEPDGEPSTGPLEDGYPETIPLFGDDGGRLYYPTDPPTPRNKHKWKTKVVVYTWEDCSNPNTEIVIDGFATVILTDVVGAPEKKVVGQVICKEVDSDDSRGGGGEYGTKGSIPGLVE